MRPRGHRPAGTVQRGGRAGPAAHGRGDSPPRPRRLRARARRGRGPRRRAARDLRHPARLAAVRGGSRRRHPRLQRRGLQPPGAARRARAARRHVRDDVRHGGRAAAARARGPPGPRSPERPVRVRLVAAGAPATDARPRPLRRAPAALLTPRRRQPRVRLGGEGALRVRRGRGRAGSRGDRRGLHALGPARSADGVSRRPPGPARRPRRVGARADRRGAPLVEPGVPPRRRPAAPTSRSFFATACGCGCARTSRSARTSPAGSTRAS